MAQIVKLKRSAVAGNVPTTSSLELGELAINTIDGRVFFEKSSSAGYEIKHIVTSDSKTTGSIELTGNLSGSATSTGSFGRTEVVDNSHVGGILTVGSTSTPDATYGDGSIELFGGGSTALVINDTRASNRRHVVFADTGGMTISSDPSNTIGVGYFRVKVANSEVFHIAEGGNTGIGVTDPAVRNGLLQLGSSGGISLLASGIISGSSTSTGSFGSLVVAGAVQGDLTVNGDIIANQYIVSSSVTHLTASAMSGSTMFGDTSDDTHQFTGSLLLSGSMTLDKSVNLSGSATSTGSFGIVESGNVIASSNISGSAKSTGSFGYGHIVDKLGIGTQSPGAHLEIRDDVNGGVLQLNGNVWSGLEPIGTIGFYNFQTNVTSSMIVTRTPNYNTKGELLFYTNNADEAAPRISVTMDSSKNVTIHSGSLEVAGKISGSSTSTGSFGDVVTDTLSVNEGFTTGTITVTNLIATNITASGNISSSGAGTASYQRAEFIDDDYGGQIELGGKAWSGYEPVGHIEFYNYQTNDMLGKIEVRIPDFNTKGEMTFYTNGAEADDPRPAMVLRSNKNVDIVTGSLQVAGNISGSSTSTGSFGYVNLPGTGSFGRLEVASTGSFGAIITSNISSSGNISASYTSTGSFGRVEIRNNDGGGNLRLAGSVWTGYESVGNIEFYNHQTAKILSKIESESPNLNNKGQLHFLTMTDGNGPYRAMTITGNKDVNILSGSLEVAGNISGSSTSTGSFGVIQVEGGHFTSASLASGGGGGGGAVGSITNGANNRIATFSSGNDLNGEANLTFDGSTLGLSGAMTATGNISGSATTTGSFGYGHIVDKLGIGVINPAQALDVTGVLQIKASGTHILLDTLADNQNNWITWKDNGNNKWEVNKDTSHNFNIYSYASSANIIQLAAAGTAAQFNVPITGSHYSGSATSTGSFGAVGIGTGTPATIFHITENTNSNLEFDGSTAGEFRIISINDARNAYEDLKLYGDNVNLNTNASGKVLFSASTLSGSSTSTGSFGYGHITDKLGIGRPDPVLALDVKGGVFQAPATSGASINGTARFGQSAGQGALDIGFHDSGTGYSWLQSRASNNYASNYNLVLQQNGGNVGIGINLPTEKLHVAGNIFATGSISGSATSTGSFGSLVVADAVQGNLTVEGDIIANQYIVSSSVTHLTASAMSGSTMFGDTSSDTHQFTGSLLITGSLTVDSGSVNLNNAVDLSGSATSTASFGMIGVGIASPASLIHVQAATTSDDAGITLSSAHPYHWSLGLDAGDSHYLKLTNASTPGGGTDYFSIGGNNIVTSQNFTVQGNFYVANRIIHEGENDVSIEFTSNQIDFQADDQSMLLTPNHLSGSATNGKGFSGSFSHIFGADTISGSATSTGSFGNGYFAGNSIVSGSTTSYGQLTVENGAPQVVIKSNDTSDGDATLSLISDNGAANEDYWKIYNEGSDNDLSFKNGNYDPVITIAHTTGHLTTTGSIISNRVDGVISGSATSTGSFGHAMSPTAVFSDRIAIGQTDLDSTYELDVTGQINSTSYSIFGGIVVGNASRIYASSEAYPFLQFNSTTAQLTGGEAAGRHIVNLLRHSGTHFQIVSGSTTLFTVSGSNGLEVPFGNISGSSTSTGSFGMLASSGSVGVGTDSPTNRFTVYGHGTSNATAPVIQLNSGTGTHHWSGLRFAKGGTDKWGIVSDYAANDTKNLVVWEYESAAARMYFETGGNVGIGNTDPAHKLDVTGTGRFTGTLTTAAITTTGITSTGNISGSATTTGSFGSLAVRDSVGIGDPNPYGILEINSTVTAEPWITFTGDQGNRLYFNQELIAAHRWGFRSGDSGEDILVIDSDNDRVGIMTDNPGVALEVVGSVSASADSTGSFGTYGNDLIPSADNSLDLGGSSNRWANLYTADFHLSNEGTDGNDVDGTEGNWTIQEGEEDLYLLNNKSGKKYKFVLQEIE